MLFCRLIVVCAAGALFAAPAASAETRYAAPAGSGDNCTADAPCTAATAVGHAASGDEIVLAGGDYDVRTTIKATVAVTIQGIAGQPRPRLIGAASLGADTLSLTAGGTVRHLEIQGNGGGGAALRLRGATGEDLVLLSTSSGGAAAMVRPSPTGTLLRDTLAVCSGCGDGAVAFKEIQNQDDGDATLAGVTAVATGSADAIQSNLQAGTGTLVDVIATGADDDIDGSSGAPLRVSYSAFRAASVNGVRDDGGNVGPAIFADAANGDFHQAPGSPTIDAGIVDARTGGVDLDGAPRVAGSAPDIGAYEGASRTAAGTDPSATAFGLPDAPAGAAADPLRGSLAPAGKPAIHRTVAVAPASGTVLVRLPGAKRAVPLDDATKLPLGAEIDTTNGTVRLTSAATSATSQTGLFSGGRFKIRQTSGSRPVTQLALSGSDFSRCGRGTAARARKAPSRRLWGRDKGGRFSTIGRSASATVRGTRWLTTDTCAGTTVTVREGAVVVRPRRKGRAVIVRAGHSHLVKAH